MKTLSFELTMPNVGSWNGRWTGADKKYFIIEKVNDKTAERVLKDAKQYPIYEGIFVRTQVGLTPPRKNYYYNFGDGWGANVCVELIDAREGTKRRKQSCGFCGYGWMVSSIIRYDDILNSSQIKELNQVSK